MKKLFTFYFSVTSRKKTETFITYSNMKVFDKILKLLSFSLDKSLKSPDQSCINEILKYTE